MFVQQICNIFVVTLYKYIHNLSVNMLTTDVKYGGYFIFVVTSYKYVHNLRVNMLTIDIKYGGYFNISFEVLR